MVAAADQRDGVAGLHTAAMIEVLGVDVACPRIVARRSQQQVSGKPEHPRSPQLPGQTGNPPKQSKKQGEGAAQLEPPTGVVDHVLP